MRPFCVLLILVSIGTTAEDVLPIRFVDRTAAAGITFKHENARSPERYLIETMGAGAAWIDFDNDGKLDLYLINSAPTKAFQPRIPLRSAL